MIADKSTRPTRVLRTLGCASGAFRTTRVAVCAALILIACLGAAAGTAAPPTTTGRPAAAQVFPPTAQPFGKSYSAWSAAWWQFTLAIPADDASVNRCRPSGVHDVYFLIGIFQPGPAPLQCDLPRNAALFLPVLNVDCSSVEAIPFFGATAPQQRRCAQGHMDQTAEIAATIDGGQVPDILRYRTLAPQFTFGPMPDPNSLCGAGPRSPTNPGGCAGETGTAVADGVYLMIKPLPAGTHDVHLHGTFTEFGFTIDSQIIISVSRDR